MAEKRIQEVAEGDVPTDLEGVIELWHIKRMIDDECRFLEWTDEIFNTLKQLTSGYGKIKAMRLEQGLRQRQLAELLGTDKPMYSKMELGARRVRRDQVPKLAELYKVDVKELMTLWLADGVYAALKEEDENLRLDAIDLAKEYFKG